MPNSYWKSYSMQKDTTRTHLTVDLLTVKLLLNSIISALGAKFMTTDIKDF